LAIAVTAEIDDDTLGTFPRMQAFCPGETPRRELVGGIPPNFGIGLF
jgi:hypothetical protein